MKSPKIDKTKNRGDEMIFYILGFAVMNFIWFIRTLGDTWDGIHSAVMFLFALLMLIWEGCYDERR